MQLNINIKFIEIYNIDNNKLHQPDDAVMSVQPLYEDYQQLISLKYVS